MHWKILHFSLIACSSGCIPYFFYFVWFIYLFWYSLGCQMYSQCAPYMRHRFRKENRNTGGLCYAIIPVLGSEANESQRCLTISRKEQNDNLFVEKYRVIYSVNVPMKLNCSGNLICCSLNVWFYCVWYFIVFFLKG